MLKVVRCNLCGADSFKIVYKTYSGSISKDDVKKDYKITDHSVKTPTRVVKCKKCGLIYTNPRPHVKSLISNYVNMVDNEYVEEERGRRISAAETLKSLKKLRKKGRLLDIGCAAGFLLDEARKDGWEVHGVELSKWAVDFAKEKFGISTIFKGILKNAGYPDNYFSAVIMKDSIEHLTDPKGTLIEIRRILKSDGILCINTPDIDSLVSRILKARWWGIKQSHLYYFTRKTLERMLEASGFVIIKCKSSPRTFSIKYWLSRFEGYSGSLYKLFRFFANTKMSKDSLLTVNLRDQVEFYARKARQLRYLEELEKTPYAAKKKNLKAIAVLPAYNAAKTLKRTVADIPKEYVDEIILVDDASKDNTVQVARSLGLKVFAHTVNKGYGANQKTCYLKALEAGADIVVMIHPDYQYDPKVIPQMVKPIQEGKADAVFGSRMMKGGALEGGMPAWKHNANVMLTAIENIIFGTFLTEYHSGFRAYSGDLLKSIKFLLNSDGFIFDTEIIAQILLHNFKIEEIPIRTRYFDEASTIGLWPSILYGLGILKTLLKYIIHTITPFKFKQFF